MRERGQHAGIPCLEDREAPERLIRFSVDFYSRQQPVTAIAAAFGVSSMLSLTGARESGKSMRNMRLKKLSPVIGAVCLILAIFASGRAPGWSEEAAVKYRGNVNLKPFDCRDITRSSFIQRVCYDKKNEYMLINLRGTYYHYCEIDSDTVSSLLGADSMGRYYNASIKGPFDCRTHRIPEY